MEDERKKNEERRANLRGGDKDKPRDEHFDGVLTRGGNFGMKHPESKIESEREAPKKNTEPVSLNRGGDFKQKEAPKPVVQPSTGLGGGGLNRGGGFKEKEEVKPSGGFLSKGAVTAKPEAEKFGKTLGGGLSRGGGIADKKVEEKKEFIGKPLGPGKGLMSAGAADKKVEEKKDLGRPMGKNLGGGLTRGPAKK